MVDESLLRDITRIVIGVAGTVVASVLVAFGYWLCRG